MTDPAGAGTARSSFLDRLGPRAIRRPQPRASIALAGAGCALAVAGRADPGRRRRASTTTAGSTGPRASSSASSWSAPACSCCSCATRGPLATAGSVAVAAGIPAAHRASWSSAGAPAGSTPRSPLSSAGLARHLPRRAPAAGGPSSSASPPTASGPPVLQLVGAGGATSLLALSPLGCVRASASPASYDSFTGSSDCTSTGPFGMTGFDQPDLAALGLVSLAVGIGCFLLSRWLDRNGRHGMSTPFVVVGLLAVVQGVIALGIELEDAHGAGAVILVAGVALAAVRRQHRSPVHHLVRRCRLRPRRRAARPRRRRPASAGGLLLLGSGLVVVAVAHLVAEHARRARRAGGRRSPAATPVDASRGLVAPPRSPNRSRSGRPSRPRSSSSRSLQPLRRASPGEEGREEGGRQEGRPRQEGARPKKAVEKATPVKKAAKRPTATALIGQPSGGSTQPSAPPPGPAGWVRGYGVDEAGAGVLRGGEPHDRSGDGLGPRPAAPPGRAGAPPRAGW